MLGWFNTPQGPTFLELVRQGLSSLEGGYDQLSSKFDHSVFRTPDPVLEGLTGNLPPARQALDVGCGTGAILQRLQARCQRVVGIDLSAQMLRVAQQQVPEAELIHGDFLATYWENEFDLITSVGVMGHIEVRQQAEFFWRVQRALQPGGSYLTVLGDLRFRPWVLLPALAFDTAMRVRNLLWRPRFVMYYLSFVLPGALQVMRRAGLVPQVLGGAFPAPFSQLQIVLARKPFVAARPGAALADGGP
jgi:ubiquinone/menaquinone biosynthesis C-methylase UbiE